MKRANVIGPAASISARIRAARASFSPTSSRSIGGSRRRPALRSIGSFASRRRRPGPTSVCPPSATGIRAAAADAVSSRSHGSATRSGSSRSDAKRSSAVGQSRSSTPNRWARSTRVSTTAASPSRSRWLPRDAGPSRSRSRPSTDAGPRPDPARSPAWARTLAARMPRSSTSARTRAWAAVSSQRRVAADVRPATTSSARRSAATDDTASRRARAVPTSPIDEPSARPMSSRSSGPSTSNASRHRPRRSSTW